jgi:hypothetical protein
MDVGQYTFPSEIHQRVAFQVDISYTSSVVIEEKNKFEK